MKERLTFLKRRQILIPGIATLAILVGFICYISFSEEDTEEIAISFYKSLWVNGDLAASKKYLLDPDDPNLEKEVQTYKANPTVLIVENPQQPQTGTYRNYFIHRSDDKKGFRIELIKENDTWKVKSFKHQNSDGYASANYYYPQLKDQWKEVQP